MSAGFVLFLALVLSVANGLTSDDRMSFLTGWSAGLFFGVAAVTTLHRYLDRRATTKGGAR
jgi:hypothetical protein